MIVSSEDVGRVCYVEMTPKSALFGSGGFNHKTVALFEKRLKGTSTIALFTPSLEYPSPFCDQRSLVAIGAESEVVLCSMRPINELYKIKRPSICKEQSLPSLDWGFGLTPTMQEKVVPILAVAQDCLIQLVYIDEESNKIVMDGFYLSEKEINSCYFVADSVLVIITNTKQVKVLYTKKFHDGDYTRLDVDKSPD